MKNRTFHLEPDEIAARAPNFDFPPDDERNDACVFELDEHGTCVLIGDATAEDRQAYGALLERRGQRALQLAQELMREAEQKKALADMFTKWTQEQLALGRDPRELIFDNFVRETGLLRPKAKQ